MFCANCGSNIDDQAKVCPNCGKASAFPPQTAPPPVQPVQIPSMSPAQPQQAAPQPYAPPPTDPKAIWSMVLGILSVVCCGIGIFAGIPAVILGHISHSNIQKSGGALKGEGLAIAGLVLGYGSVLLSFLVLPAIVIPSLLKARITANESAAAATVRTVSTAEATYAITYPQSGFAPDLATLGPGSSVRCSSSGPSATSACLINSTLGCSSNWCVKDSYKYSVMATGSPTPNEFVVTATPVNNNTGRKSYCATSDSIVRFQNGLVSAPVSVETCQTWTAL
ncbi:MAG TPA: DUF4190 domain-containing protein [Candidatus Angelobacter sp.]|nr:DUF4190 domain-containing protein [Candidatus Angelobacter sp.]